MRLIIYGTGAVGGVVGGSLARAGHEVVAIARGRQLDALRAGDLRLHTVHGTRNVPLKVVGTPADVEFALGDLVMMTVKSQDTEHAVRELAKHADLDIPVVCVQNGVANERATLRYFRNVYGAVVMMPATYVQPGEVSVYGDPYLGTIDVGRYPKGLDRAAQDVVDALTESEFDSRVSPDIMRWKYGKLVGNLTNTIEAICGLGTRNGELGALVTREGEAALAAAGITYATEADEDERRAGNYEHDTAAGVPRKGASSWQSVFRGSGSIETDYLNGEVALIGRLHGVPTPANDLIQRLANEIANSASLPGSIAESQVLDRLAS